MKCPRCSKEAYVAYFFSDSETVRMSCDCFVLIEDLEESEDLWQKKEPAK